MKKNPLVLLLALSGVCFLLFTAFVFFAMGSLVKEGKSSSLLTGGNSIGVLTIEGAIMDSDKTLKLLRQWEEDSSIRGIIVRVNSPGGAVAPSQEIHDAIIRVKKAKPVIASFESLAASGGYYIAVAADRIITNPGTITGSIGVISQFMNLSEIYKWAKVEPYNLKSGKFKDTGSDSRPMTPEEKAVMQGMVDNIYLQFVGAVATGRKMPVEKVKELADGRIYSGEQAVKLGLADKLGGFDVALDDMKELAKIKGKPNLVYPDPKKPRMIELFSSSLAQGIVNAVWSKFMGEGLQSTTSADGFVHQKRMPYYF